eukprot:scpid74120/ scgid33773/ Mediator of RNA polymerase II transcription subunit 4; Mediator complex subunit 4
MAGENQGLTDVLGEYDRIVSQLAKGLLPEDSTATLRSAALLEQDKNCAKLVESLGAADANLQKVFDKAIPRCTVSSQGAASSGSFSVSEDVRSVQKDLLEAQQCLDQAVFQAKKQLDAISQSERGSIKADTLVKFAHRISQANAVAAPPGWTAGDPRRPYPSDFEMRIGSLGSLGAPTGAADTAAAGRGLAEAMDTTASASKPHTTSQSSADATGTTATFNAAESNTAGPAGSRSPPIAQWQPMNFNEGDFSSDSSDSDSPLHSHGPPSHPPAQGHSGSALVNGSSEANGNAASSRAPANAEPGHLSADSSSSSSSSDEND